MGADLTFPTIKEHLAGTFAPDGKAQPFYGLELLRFVCAFTIVWGHMHAPFAIIGYAGLDAFIILSVALSTRSSLRHPFGTFLYRRVIRILIPWLVWCGFYLALRGLTQGPASVFALSDPNWLLIGPVIHLWFLPFLMLSSPFTFLATHLPHGRIFGAAMIVTLVPLCCFGLYLERTMALPEPYLQWAFSFPSLAYAVMRASGRAISPVLIIAGICGGMCALGHAQPALFLALAALAFELALRAKWVGSWAKFLGDTAFGIYLMHPFCVMVLTRVIDLETQRLTLTFAVFAMSFVGSVILGWMIAQISRWGSALFKQPSQ
ncbi:MAG: acyltransferase [Thalassovita sp.]